jgi:hypothetical protein
MKGKLMPKNFVVTITRPDGYVFRHLVAASQLQDFICRYAEVVQLNETLKVSEID